MSLAAAGQVSGECDMADRGREHALFLPSFSASSSKNDTRMESMAVSYTPMIWIAIFNAKKPVKSSGAYSHRFR